MKYCDNINEIIYNTFNNPSLKYQLKYFDEITKLAMIILERTPNITKFKYKTHIPLNESIEICNDFFKTINPTYSHMFQNILQEKSVYNVKEEHSVKFYRQLGPGEASEYDNQHHYNSSGVGNDGSVHIDYSKNLEDVFTITHEITHKFSHPKKQCSVIKQFLGETSTIAMENLLEEYLISTEEFDSNEVMINKHNNFLEIYEDACAVIFENILINLYKKYNKVNDKVFLKYLNSLDKDTMLYEMLINNYTRFLKQIDKINFLTFPKRQRYIIGLLLGADISENIKNNPEKKEELFYLIHILGNTSLLTDRDLRLLSYLDIPIVQFGDFFVDDKCISRLTQNYQKVLDSDLLITKNRKFEI